MRLSAAFSEEAHRYRVYDYTSGEFRHDLCWVDDEINQVGIGFAMWGQEHVFAVEQRKRVLIIPGAYWIALDLPVEEGGIEHKISIPELFGSRDLEREVVR